jgi:hypothetical protein
MTLTITTSGPQAASVRVTKDPTAPATDGGARPRVRLGAEAPGGLGLPDAQPTASQLYAPRGVHLEGDVLVVADTGNHRVLIWHGIPTEHGTDADVVLGQPDFITEGCRGAARGMRLPTGIAVIDGDLHVADAWHHRILVYQGIPTSSDTAPTSVIGQPDLLSVEPNRGGECDATSFYWPFGLAHVAGWTWVTDTGNKRVLGWEGRLEPGRPADVVLGQDDEHGRSDNRGALPDGGGMRWPHAVAGTEEVLFVADAGNHRVLVWNAPPTTERFADAALGQVDLLTTGEWPYGPQGPERMRFPYSLALDAGRLAVADTANNRVLLWRTLPTGSGAPADEVLGQDSFDGGGENRWESVRDDTLCWPYGIALAGTTLAIADSGNNRVMLWDVPLSPPLEEPCA